MKSYRTVGKVPWGGARRNLQRLFHRNANDDESPVPNNECLAEVYRQPLRSVYTWVTMLLRL